MKEIPGDHPDEANLMQPVIALSASESPLEPDGLESPDLLESTEVRADPSQEIMAAAPTPLHRILEAMLFVGGAPLTAERAITAIRGLTA